MPDAREWVANCARDWEDPGLGDALRVEESRRMTRALGRCWPERRLIRIAAWLAAANPALRREVLVHELAHLHVFRRHGPGVLPHGREWRAAMRRSGLEPRVRVPAGLLPSGAPRLRSWLHSCPGCGARREAGRPVRSWRCRRCADGPTRGRLEIERLG